MGEPEGGQNEHREEPLEEETLAARHGLVPFQLSAATGLPIAVPGGPQGAGIEHRRNKLERH